MTAKQKYLLDEVHPNIEGYSLMADAAKEVMERLISE